MSQAIEYRDARGHFATELDVDNLGLLPRFDGGPAIERAW